MQEVAVERFPASGGREVSKMLPWIRPVIAAVLVGFGYYLGAKIGFALTFAPRPVSTLWPPNSILLAALALTPIRWWWLMLVAVLPAHVLIQVQSGVPTPMIVCWFISNASEAVLGAWCLHFLNDPPLRFDSIRQVTTFVFVALFAPFVSSFLDAGFVVLNRFGTGSFWQLWRLRFSSNVLAELIIVPLIVMWGSERLAAFRRLSPTRWLETAALVFGLLAVSIGAFGWNHSDSNTAALLYVPLPFLLWAAVRFGPKGISISLTLVTFMAIWNAVHGRGPFISNSPEQNALSIQVFLITISVPLMVLAAVIQELGRAKEDARGNEERLTLALSAAQMGTWDWHITDGVTRWSDETKRIFGLSPIDSETTPEGFFSLLHPEDRESVGEAINRSINEGAPYESEFRIPKPGGGVRWVRGKGKVLFDDEMRPLRMIGVNADITRQKDADLNLRQSHQQIRALAGRLINAQEAERRRISHELHDDLNQRVAGLSLTISRLKRKVLGQPEITDELNGLYQQTNRLSDDIRELSHQLHPATLEHLGLADALEAHIREFAREAEIPTTFNAQITQRKIPFEVSVCLYRIALEALRNVARHSHAGSASVVLEEHEQVLTMKVADSGIGFDVAAAKRSSGLGLLSAAERINLLQGTFEIVSNSQEGTELIAKIPLR